ncbi:extracellular calcium-sensing receptor-like [Eublepharis macularius]|uniref:Extracellular calcium-sensing receptor-like n=1 Tax=Eublepharis macularius TaxID=481883 RepID=A0AA97K8B6_EUBMA|nr:extracellular calcium-sensing receptor-like [Eublepharis macularius]
MGLIRDEEAVLSVLGIGGHKCHLLTFGMEAFEREGDILIGGIFPLHSHQSSDVVSIAFTERPNPTSCHRSVQRQRILPNNSSSEIAKDSFVRVGQNSNLSLWFYKLIQTMVYAVEELNQDPTILPNVTLGFQIFDSCQTVSRALLGTMRFLTGQQKAIPNFRCQRHPLLAGIIAESGIVESRTIARLLDLNRYPQISYFPTGPVTSDGSQFLSFFRTVPSNKFQALGLARLVLHFSWTWIGLLGENSEYGKQGVEVVREQIVKSSACVAFLHMLPLSPNTENTLTVVQTIAESQARVIVAFCGIEVLTVLDQLYEHGVEGRVWLYSESMSHIIIFSNRKALQMLDGSLAVVSHKEKVPGLKDFILRLHPSSSPEDVFIQEFWSNVFNCQWNTSSGEGTDSTHRCTGQESLENGMNSFLSMPGFGLAFSVHNAVYAIAHALHSMAQKEFRGPKKIGNKNRVETHGFKPWKLLQYLRKVSFKNKAGEEVSFDEHGDLPAVLDIFNTRFLPEGNFRIAPVGRIAFSPSRNKELEINESAILWAGGGTKAPVSVCTPNCPRGYHRAHLSHRATCCFDCIPCADGEMANQTDSSICIRCPEDQWPNEGQTRCLPKRELFLSFHEPLGASLAGTSVCGSFLPVLILALFVAHRDTPLVRANSRELSYLLLSGLTVSFLSCLLFLGRPTRSTCLLRPVVFGLNFSLCLSCLLAKTLLVVTAFKATNPGSHMKQWLNSRVPRAVVLWGCLPQFLLCSVWLAVSPPSPEKDTYSIPQAVTLLCDKGSQAAFWAMLAYLALLAGFSLAGAFLARNLPDAFNEAWLICFSLLGCLGVWLAFIPVYLTAKGWYESATAAFAILGSSAALLSGMFFPKCYILLLHPELNTKGYFMRKGKGSAI